MKRYNSELMANLIGCLGAFSFGGMAMVLISFLFVAVPLSLMGVLVIADWIIYPCRHISHKIGTIRVMPLIGNHKERYGVRYKEEGCEGWCHELIYCKRKHCNYWKYGEGVYTTDTIEKLKRMNT